MKHCPKKQDDSCYGTFEWVNYSLKELTLKSCSDS